MSDWAARAGRVEPSAPVHVLAKFIVVVDDDVNVRDWKEVIWALTTRVDPVRDTMLVENTPIDYLDFASPVSGLGSKMGLDATNKWPGETQREWGRTISMDAEVQARMDGIFETLGVFSNSGLILNNGVGSSVQARSIG